MRTTLTIDDDVLAMARALAERRKKTLGAVVSDMLRQALYSSEQVFETRNGIPLLPRRPDGVPVTPEMVNDLRDELP